MARRGREAERDEEEDRVEQISKREGVYYYGEQKCFGPDDAYRKFRDDYHAYLGKAVYRRLNRIGDRRERVHTDGIYFADRGYVEALEGRYGGYGKVTARMMGLIGVAYCKMVGVWDMPDIPEEEQDAWYDWLFCHGSGMLRTVGVKDKVGRTAKNAKKRYR